MKEPVFLSLEDVLEIHRDQIQLYGGSHGVRDVGLLQSAVCMPLARFGGDFLHKDLFEMAAAYLFHLTMNHPFVDGNKRVGVAAALVFLDLNGIEIIADEAKFEKVILGMIAGKKTKEQIGRFLKRNSRRSKDGE